MTIWEKICGEVNEKIEFLIEKNRTAAVKNRLKLTLARENKQMGTGIYADWPYVLYGTADG